MLLYHIKANKLQWLYGLFYSECVLILGSKKCIQPGFGFTFMVTFCVHRSNFLPPVSSFLKIKNGELPNISNFLKNLQWAEPNIELSRGAQTWLIFLSFSFRHTFCLIERNVFCLIDRMKRIVSFWRGIEEHWLRSMGTVLVSQSCCSALRDWHLWLYNSTVQLGEGYCRSSCVI